MAPEDLHDLTETQATSVSEASIGAALAKTRSRLSATGIPDSAAQARALVRAATGVSRTELLTDPDRPISQRKLALLESFIARRVKREPLQYITGTVEFFGRPFRVDRRVLIPRPETELLIEQAVARVRETQQASPRILDVGTGSGVLAVTVAAELPSASMVATDISGAALVVAKQNAVQNGVADRIEFVNCSLAAGTQGTYDIVISNPPYVLASYLDGLHVQPELAYEPRLALDGGDDGMAVYRQVFRTLGELLSPGGAAFLEIDPPVVDACMSEASFHLPDTRISVLTDLAGLERCLVIELDQ